jgi:hypothetical protein
MTGRDTDDQRTGGDDPFREWDAAYVLGALDPADRRAFEVVTAPLSAKAPEFGDVARVVAGADTLDAFLRDIRTKYPETTGPVPQPGAPAAPRAGAALETKPAS